jgi:hypothetical protein
LEPIKSSHQANTVATHFHGTRSIFKSPEKNEGGAKFFRNMLRSVWDAVENVSGSRPPPLAPLTNTEEREEAESCVVHDRALRAN